MHYLDNAATTHVDEQVIETVAVTLAENFGNPSSLHILGMNSEDIISKSRKTIACALECMPKEIIFTSCGTESNNIAILGAALARKTWADNVVCTGYEHPSVENPMHQLEKLDFKLKLVKPGQNGIVDTDAVLQAVDSKTAVVAIMQVNNEIGTIIDVNELAQKIKLKNSRTAVHVDGVQGFLKIPFSLKNSKIDTYSISGHKIYAPKGIGALYLRSGHNIKPPYLGGGQENGIRPGTENIGYIAGLEKAVQKLLPQVESNLKNANELCTYMRCELGKMQNVIINSPLGASPYNFNFSVIGIRSEVMLHYLEKFSVYVSSGSACSKGLGSHTLTAMNLPKERIDSAIRVSIGKDTTQADIDALLNGIKSGITELAHTKL